MDTYRVRIRLALSLIFTVRESVMYIKTYILWESFSTPSLISSLGSRYSFTWSHSLSTMDTPVLVGLPSHQDRMWTYILFLYILVWTRISLLSLSVLWNSFSARIASLSWIFQAHKPCHAFLFRKISLFFAPCLTSTPWSSTLISTPSTPAMMNYGLPSGRAF